jgi:hypothetical protein
MEPMKPHDAIILRLHNERAAGHAFAMLMLRLRVRLPLRACAGAVSEPLDKKTQR